MVIFDLFGCNTSGFSHTNKSCTDSRANRRKSFLKNLKRNVLSIFTNSKTNKYNVSKNETIAYNICCASSKHDTSETFCIKNISSSTELEDTCSFRTSPNKDNLRSLGILQNKRSPLYGPPLNSTSKAISLRSQQPFYTQLFLHTSSSSSESKEKFKQNFDCTDMNGSRLQNNGPVGTFSKTYLESGSVSSALTDINRNDATRRNWSVMTSTSTEKREHLYKILVIGELGTGKTSFIKRYVHQFFSQNYRATIGVDFALKVLHWDPNTIVRLQLWDIAGQERFGNMTRVYYKEAVGAFIVFDVTRSGTFDCVSKWKEDLDSKVQLPDGNPIPCILLANKCDQDKQGVVTNTEKMDEYVKENGFAGWFETSAKENINIDEAARALVNKILLNDKLINAADLADSEKFNLNSSANQTPLDGKSKCSC